MTFQGVTGVDDMLQDGVRATIEDLYEGNIRVWMLTGDKKETAKCIAIKTGLCSSIGNFCEIQLTKFKKSSNIDYTGTLGYKTRTKDDMFIEQLENANRKNSGDNVQTPTKETIGDYRRNFTRWLDSLEIGRDDVLIVTGKDLDAIYRCRMELEFINKAVHFKSVIFCRCSPQLKADITSILRTKLNKIVCAIGDGGNDVAMIQQASIGLGIEGKEGLQAALSSDYSLKEFKHLKVL